MDGIRFLPQGETGLVVEFGNQIDPIVNRKVHTLAQKITAGQAGAIEAVVPTYRSLLVYFDPLQTPRKELIERIAAIADDSGCGHTEERIAKTVVIPTLYGGEAGPDLQFVAEHNRLTAEDVIRIHTSVPYRIYMMGFTPGFPYLGGMSDNIAAPRLSSPRTHIPAGSVGIAGSQTGLYPVESPGGWRLIGRTPLRVFDPSCADPFLYSAGDFLQFESISEQEYIRIFVEVGLGSYSARTFPAGEAKR